MMIKEMARSVHFALNIFSLTFFLMNRQARNARNNNALFAFLDFEKMRLS
jgi:hypothetical protein